MKKKWGMVLLALVVSLCLGVFYMSFKAEKEKPRLKEVVENLYRPITRTEYEIYKEKKSTAKWIEDRFKPYMSQMVFEEVLHQGLYVIPVQAYEHKKTITVEKIGVHCDKKEGNFVAIVKINQEKAKVTGQVKLDEKGKIIAIKQLSHKDLEILINNP